MSARQLGAVSQNHRLKTSEMTGILQTTFRMECKIFVFTGKTCVFAWFSIVLFRMTFVPFGNICTGMCWTSYLNTKKSTEIYK